MASVDQTASSPDRPRGEDDELGPAGARAYLLVLENDTSSLFHLPRTASITIGRASDAELRLTHASVSRRHATIRIDDGVARVADLESHNGTRLNGEPVSGSRTLASGDVIAIGEVLLVLHAGAPAVVSRAVYGELAWRGRLAEELDRALTYRRNLAVVAIAGIPTEDVAAAARAVGAGLRLIDVLAEGDDGQLLVILPESDRDAACVTAHRALTAAGADTARAGVAACPADACDADTLLVTARTSSRGAAARTVARVSESATVITLGDRTVLCADPAMIRQYALLERLAPSDLPILVTGETGVGKENAAYAVHHWSKRTGGFLAVNCAAIGPEGLVEGELFGHDKGAFTGATTAKAGLFESAAGGTVFLDEVAELPLGIQAKLLRALETRKIVRLGETRERAIDVRLVAATNRPLDAEVDAGRFRRDLYFRLSGATVILPPLRDRRGELPVLAREFLRQASARANRPAMELTPAAMQALLTHHWPGNVRELRNVMDYVAAAAPDSVVEPYDLPERLGGAAAEPARAPAPAPVADIGTAPTTAFRPVHDELRELEKKRMTEALLAAGGVKSKAAQLIDMPIRTFTLKVKQYGL